MKFDCIQNSLIGALHTPVARSYRIVGKAAPLGISSGKSCRPNNHQELGFNSRFFPFENSDTGLDRITFRSLAPSLGL